MFTISSTQELIQSSHFHAGRLVPLKVKNWKATASEWLSQHSFSALVPKLTLMCSVPPTPWLLSPHVGHEEAEVSQLNSPDELAQLVVARLRPEPKCSWHSDDPLFFSCVSERAGSFLRATQQRGATPYPEAAH